MPQMIIQYVLIIIIVVGLTYVAYLLKDKGTKISEDYFGLAHVILDTLEIQEATPENIKKIIRTISKTVNFVEANYKNEDNVYKEEKAFELAKEAIMSLNFNSTINDESIRYLIRLACAFLPAKS